MPAAGMDMRCQRQIRASAAALKWQIRTTAGALTAARENDLVAAMGGAVGLPVTSGAAKMVRMCATVLWAIASVGWTSRFEDFTRECLGVAPQRSPVSVHSRRMPRDPARFTLTVNLCDCDCLVGLGDHPAERREVSATAWLHWLQELPLHASQVRRIALARSREFDVDRAWVPERARGVDIEVVNEDWLRRVPEEVLFTIDYPRSTRDAPAR